MNSSLKPLIPILVGGLLVSVCSLALWLVVTKGNSDVSFGRVVSVTDTALVIADKDANETSFSLSPATTVRRKNETLTTGDLTPGLFLQVYSEPNASKDDIATSIRVLNPPPDRRHHE